MSAAEGILFAEVVNDFGKQVKALGPSGEGEGLDRGELASRLKNVTKLVPYLKLVQPGQARVTIEPGGRLQGSLHPGGGRADVS